ncbi:tetratricopeptide repeat protein [Pseudanabaena sp. PCC 6802]|uniref:tetratricopeptide repeat protein n=1 Tax=Pseudanabaena sp. PCC 6802 TaxID=118173 RepID=UPI000349780E|nr:tetratricopeptide repeat protein [Pseudanabaena sp. PCC 6802]
MRILIEGWRFVPHSYAVINQFQLLEMLKRRNLKIFHIDVPFLKPWQPSGGLFNATDEESLRNIPQPSGSQPIDVRLRMSYPPNLRDSSAVRTFVFSTTEWGHVITSDLISMGISSFGQAHADSSAVILTSSQWSREGFLRSGADRDRLEVVPHGVDPHIYKPLDPESRQQLRQALGWQRDFIFLNVGNPTRNKGLPYLFKAFAAIAERYPTARLILKGVNSLFPGKDFAGDLKRVIGDVLTTAEMARIESRFTYIGEAMSFAQVAKLYQAADVYVSPYIAEGFNLPVLEAIACGLPVICTAGGSTDDFTMPDFAKRIDSTLKVDKTYDEKPIYLEPNIDHLITLMAEVIESPSFIALSREKGPAFVAEGFTWERVVDRLLAVFQAGEQSATASDRDLLNSIALLGGSSHPYIEQAQQLQQQNKLNEAIAYYQKAIAIEPSAINAYWQLGDILHQQSKPTEALLCKYHALAIAPQRFSADIHLNLANALVQRNCLQEATNIYRTLLSLHPERWEVRFNLGVIFMKQGKFDAAIASYRICAELAPDNALAHYSLGNALKKQGDLDAAIASYRDAIARQPHYPEAFYNLANTLVELKQIDAAIPAYARAIAQRSNFIEAQFNLATILMEKGNLPEAASLFQQVLQIEPAYVECYINLATIFQRQNRLAEAIAPLQRALQVRSDCAEAHYQLFNILSQQDLAAAREAADSFVRACGEREQVIPFVCAIAIYLKSGLHQEATARFLELEQRVDRKRDYLSAIELEALYVKLLYFLPFMRDDRAADANFSKLISAKYIALVAQSDLVAAARSTRACDPGLQAHARKSNGVINQNLRIGFISMHLKRHPIGWCACDFMRELGHLTPHIYIYTTRQFSEDDRTQKFAQITDKFYRTKQTEPAAIAREITTRIIADDLDVLIDLDSIMNLVHTEIMHYRPAKVCLTWPSFDAPFICDRNYEICDWHTHPPGVEVDYLEQLLRMPDSHMAVSGFDCVSVDRDAVRAQYGIQPAQVVYLFSAPGHKLSMESLQAQIEILQRVPESVLIHKGIGDVEIIKSLYRGECESQSVDFNRIMFLPRSATEEEHRTTYAIADVSLDSYPYNGGTHNVEALWCHLPLVTRVGDRSFARMGLSFLNTLGISEGIARTWEDYVAWGVRFGLDPDLLQSVRAKLQQSKESDRLSPLWNPQKYAADLYTVLTELVQSTNN